MAAGSGEGSHTVLFLRNRLAFCFLATVNTRNPIREQEGGYVDLTAWTRS